MTPAGLLIPTDDMEATLTQFCDVLGLKVKFRDGDRYCALDFAGQTLGLVSGEEKIVTSPALVFRVDDLPIAVANLTLGGAITLLPPHDGPHETRAVMRTVGGVDVVLSARR